MHPHELIEQYENACDDLVDRFINLLFKGEYVERDWVGNEIGGVVNFADYFASIDNVVEYFRLDMTQDEWFKHYDWCLDNYTEGKPLPVNMKHWLLAERSKFKY